VGVTPSVPVKANSGVRARVPAAGKVLDADDKPTLLREDQHYLHYITIITLSADTVGSRDTCTRADMPTNEKVLRCDAFLRKKIANVGSCVAGLSQFHGQFNSITADGRFAYLCRLSAHNSSGGNMPYA